MTIERDKVLAILSETTIQEAEWANKLGVDHDAGKDVECIEMAEWVKEEYGITVTPQEVFDVQYGVGSTIGMSEPLIAAWDAFANPGSSEMSEFIERMKKR